MDGGPGEAEAVFRLMARRAGPVRHGARRQPQPRQRARCDRRRAPCRRHAAQAIASPGVSPASSAGRNRQGVRSMTTSPTTRPRSRSPSAGLRGANRRVVSWRCPRAALEHHEAGRHEGAVAGQPRRSRSGVLPGARAGLGCRGARGWAHARTYDRLALVAAVAAPQPGDHVLVMSNGGFGGVHRSCSTRSERKSHPGRRVRERTPPLGCRSGVLAAARAPVGCRGGELSSLMYSNTRTTCARLMVRATSAAASARCGDDAEQEDDSWPGHHLDAVGRDGPEPIMRLHWR